MISTYSNPSSRKVTQPEPKLRTNANFRPTPIHPGTGWANTEFRSFQFSDTIDKDGISDGALDGDNATIIETVESRKRRGRSAEAPSRQEQKEFYRQAVKGWDDLGLQISVADREAAKQNKENGQADKKVPEGSEVGGSRV